MWMTDVKETVGVSFKDYDSAFSLTTSEGLEKKNNYDRQILSVIVGS
jgi:hypothetical protein